MEFVGDGSTRGIIRIVGDDDVASCTLFLHKVHELPRLPGPRGSVRHEGVLAWRGLPRVAVLLAVLAVGRRAIVVVATA